MIKIIRLNRIKILKILKRKIKKEEEKMILNLYSKLK